MRFIWAGSELQHQTHSRRISRLPQGIQTYKLFGGYSRLSVDS